MTSNKRGRRSPPVAPVRRELNRRDRTGFRFTKSPNPRQFSTVSSVATEQGTAARPGALDEALRINDIKIFDGRAHITRPLGGRNGPATCDCPDDTTAAAAEAGGTHMALEMKTNGAVGCAYFVAATATLYLQDATRVVGLELVESLLFQARPTSIIVPSRAPDAFIDFLDRLSCEAGEGSTAEDEERGFVLRSVVSSDFNPEYGRQLLARSDRAGTLQDRSTVFTTAVEDIEEYERHGDARSELGVGASTRNKLMHLGTFINLDDQVSLGCASALICDLERRKATTMATDTDFLRIRSVLTVTYNDCMFVTADTLLSLQIFRPDLQLATGRGAATNRDGSTACASQGKRSVFDLFHPLALTTQGRGMLREIFIRPSTDLVAIDARHQSISNLLDPKNQNSVGYIRAALKIAKNILPMLAHLRKGIYFPGHFSLVKQSAWANLQDFCSAVLQLLQVGPEICAVINKALAEIDSGVIFQIQEKLTRTIDFQESRSSGRNAVAYGVNPELDALKSTYGLLQNRLEGICLGHKARLTCEAQDDIVGCIFHPQMGYLLVASALIRARNGNGLSSYPAADEELDFGSWEEVLQEDGLIYFKTPSLRDVDTEFGDLAGRIIDLEVEMFHFLGSEILEREDALLRASNAIGHIDSILALASGAKSLNLTRPQMTEENVLYIRNGRHLLQEIGPGAFVPNDCQLAGGSGAHVEDTDFNFPRMLGTANNTPRTVVLTGPNHSGKSVYLKQVAIILFLAHIGSFVPAEEAIVGITDKILTRIATRESVSRDESAFGVDLRQAAFSINFATRRSLVLIDEFGKGTATADGAALFDALLDHFLQMRRGDAPKVLAATHFHEIFERRGFRQHPHLGMCHMSVAVNPGALRPGEKVKFLHVLQEGQSTRSFGCHCAAISGVTPTVVERASQITRLLGQGTSLSKVCLQSRVKNIERLKGNEDQARHFLVRMADALDSSAGLQTPRELLQCIFGGGVRGIPGRMRYTATLDDH